eukprot:14404454-Ditylum_brightwellii.AAC.1
MCLFATNTYPDELFEEFSVVWLTLLFKKWPIEDQSDIKYHPIGAGTNLHCGLSAIVAKVESPNFAKACLASNNFGIGIRGSTHFVVFTVLTECQKHVFLHKITIETRKYPQTMLLLTRPPDYV